jgi:hypothetical protein
MGQSNPDDAAGVRDTRQRHDTIDALLNSAWEVVTSNMEAAAAVIQQAKALSEAGGYEAGID